MLCNIVAFKLIWRVFKEKAKTLMMICCVEDGKSPAVGEYLVLHATTCAPGDGLRQCTTSPEVGQIAQLVKFQYDMII